MTQEDKQLLLKDLCSRLPYGVNVEIDGYNIGVLKGIDGDTISTDRGINYPPRIIKPYLRPMSSMTEEEGERLEQIAKETLGDFMFEAEEDGGAIYHMTKWKTLSHAMFDYLNSIHIDYRGLIEIGLAFEAPDGMYQIMKL